MVYFCSSQNTKLSEVHTLDMAIVKKGVVYLKIREKLTVPREEKPKSARGPVGVVYTGHQVTLQGGEYADQS